jgi:hypothetical protein
MDQKRKYRAFLLGSRKAMQKYKATDDDITKSFHRKSTDPDDHQYLPHPSAAALTSNLASATSTEQREMAQLLELLQDGGVGFMPETKSNGWVRIMFENWNSLGIFTHRWKIDRLNYLLQHLKM